MPQLIGLLLDFPDLFVLGCQLGIHFLMVLGQLLSVFDELLLNLTEILMHHGQI